MHLSASMDLEDMISISAESRNETASDIPGSGRLLGRVYTALGRGFEAVLSLVAHSMGRGPIATGNKIVRLAWALADPGYSSNHRNPSETIAAAKTLDKSCRVLVKYTRYVRCIIDTTRT